MTLPYATAADAFNLLCDKKIGEGIHRDVFTCRINDALVVKVETDGPFRYFANVMEMKFWSEHADHTAVAQWLAPCEYMSPDGLVMLQRRVEPLRRSDVLPEKLPTFLTDIKRENFGWLDGKIVCVDYAMHLDHPNTRLKKVKWDAD